MSEENVELVRRLYAQLASEGSTREFEQRLTDDALGRYLDPEIEWVPVSHSLLAADSYRGFVRIGGRTHELEVEETQSSLLTIRDGRVVHVQAFANPEGAPEAAGLPP